MITTNMVQLRKKWDCPDEIMLERLRRNPELGPKILFFSGGTALRALSAELNQYTTNSVHLITPFDSGGSSYHLREAFGMLAVGDFRNRLMALADQAFHGSPRMLELFSHRLPVEMEQDQLADILEAMIRGEHPLVASVPGPMRRLVRSHLRIFYEHMPSGFDLRGANIGNLVLVGGYLNHDRDLDPVLFLFGKLAEVRGVVRPVSTENLHLGAELEDGEVIIGQHKITDRKFCEKKAKVKKLFLNRDLHTCEPVRAQLEEKISDQIGRVNLICYPFGSFYTSVLACLLPHGVREAIAANDCPKVYTPNFSGDVEQRGLTIYEEVLKLAEVLDCRLQEVTSILDFVILDQDDSTYDRAIEEEKLKELGIQVVRAPLEREGRLLKKNLISLLSAIAG